MTNEIKTDRSQVSCRVVLCHFFGSLGCCVFLACHLYVVDGLVVAAGGHGPPHRPVEQLPGAVALAEVPEQLQENPAAALTCC